MKQISASAFISLILLAAIPFEAKAQQPLQLEYAVYAGGIYVLDAAIGLDDDEKTRPTRFQLQRKRMGLSTDFFLGAALLKPAVLKSKDAISRWITQLPAPGAEK